MKTLTIGELQSGMRRIMKRTGKEYVVVNVKTKTIIGAIKVLPMPTVFTEVIKYREAK